MNCDDFGQLMNQRLDERVPVDGDEALLRHACQCDSCGAQLDAWRQIAAIMPSGKPLPSRKLVPDRPQWIGRMSLVAVAAVVLIAVTVHWNSVDVTLVNSNVSGSSNAAEPLDSSNSTVLAQAGELDPIGWWRRIQDRDWIGQTMPTVKSVQQGVAPLGRSFMRAATMLTIGGPNQTS